MSDLGLIYIGLALVTVALVLNVIWTLLGGATW